MATSERPPGCEASLYPLLALEMDSPTAICGAHFESGVVPDPLDVTPLDLDDDTPNSMFLSETVPHFSTPEASATCQGLLSCDHTEQDLILSSSQHASEHLRSHDEEEEEEEEEETQLLPSSHSSTPPQLETISANKLETFPHGSSQEPISSSPMELFPSSNVSSQQQQLELSLSSHNSSQASTEYFEPVEPNLEIPSCAYMPANATNSVFPLTTVPLPLPPPQLGRVSNYASFEMQRAASAVVNHSSYQIMTGISAPENEQRKPSIDEVPAAVSQLEMSPFFSGRQPPPPPPPIATSPVAQKYGEVTSGILPLDLAARDATIRALSTGEHATYGKNVYTFGLYSSAVVHAPGIPARRLDGSVVSLGGDEVRATGSLRMGRDSRSRSSVVGVKKSRRSRGRRPKTQTASRFCHICLRRGERVGQLKCSNLQKGTCRKVTCEKCFDEYGWDWRTACNNKDWQCSHCRNECPERAQCFIYKRTNDRRHQALMVRKAEESARKKSQAQNVLSSLEQQQQQQETRDVTHAVDSHMMFTREDNEGDNELMFDIGVNN